MLNIYVAGKHEEKEKVQKLIKNLENMGHNITENWTKTKQAKTQSELIQYAKNDYSGVVNSDIFIGIFEKELSYQGSLVELGIALNSNKKCWIIGNAISKCIFLAMPNITMFPDIDSMLNSLFMIPRE